MRSSAFDFRSSLSLRMGLYIARHTRLMMVTCGMPTACTRATGQCYALHCETAVKEIGMQHADGVTHATCM